jgi:glycosyltransferase involved in cell wall biosynthesis
LNGELNLQTAGLHVLMISLDTSLATKPDGGALARHIDYAERAGKLTIVVYTPPGVDGPLYPAPNLTVIPTNSAAKPLFVADALRIAGRVIDEQRPDLITTQDVFSTGLVGWMLRGRAAVPILVQNHCYFIDNDAWLAEKPIKNHLFNALGKFVSRRADLYRTVNTTEAQTYLERGGQPERVVTQPLGTASPTFTEPPPADAVAAARASVGLVDAEKVIIWVGYPVPFKRIPVLFDVFDRVLKQDPDARLLLIGDMSRSVDDLYALRSRMGLDAGVVMYGPVPHGDLPAYYHMARVFAMSSAYEGIPRVLMEASAAGLPLVGFDRVGVADVIADGVNGYVIPEGDVDGMARRLVQLLNEAGTAAQLGASARERAVDRFSAEKNAAGVAAMWQQAVALGMRE